MLAYNEDEEVFLILDLEKYEKLKYLGYDKGNQALMYERYDIGRKIYKVPLSTDYRIFVPIARNSRKFKKKYKMELMVDLSFLVMLTMAKEHIKNNEKNIRSLVA